MDPKQSWNQVLVRRGRFIVGLVLALSIEWTLSAPFHSGTVQFNRDVRPILSDACFQCHGFDAQARKAGLRLDLREDAIKVTKSGVAAVVPGKASDSELIKRIRSKDPDEVMPPLASHKTLKPEQISILEKWINQGAHYQGHWAFEPVTQPTPPRWPSRRSIAPNPIDRFIGARLAESKLKPSPEADPITLIRRLTLDLTGLPPTPQEVDAYTSDKQANAYEKVVDRLLKSPRFGERMAMDWLDYARYADSHGYQTDSSRSMWPWRDWVIQAFNENVPFDKFTISQLAGDLLPNPQRNDIIATGFHRNHRINGEGGIIGEEWRVEAIADRVETTGLTWLGLTLNCSRCHDHKYDPIAQKEFYQLFAYFNNIDESGTLSGVKANRSGGNPEPTILVPTPEQEAKMASLKHEVEEAKRKVEAFEAQAPELLAAWEPEFKRTLVEAEKSKSWELAEPSEVSSKGGAKLTKRADGAYLASGPNPESDVYTIKVPIGVGPLTGIRFESFPDPSLPNGSLGRYPNGNFILSRVEAELQSASTKEVMKIKFGSASADFSQSGYPAESLVDTTKGKGWAIAGNEEANRVARKAMLILDSPVDVSSPSTLVIRLVQQGMGGHNIGCFQLAFTRQPKALIQLNGLGVPASIREILHTASDKRSPDQIKELLKFHRTLPESTIHIADKSLLDKKKSLDQFEGSIPTTMIMRELNKSRDAFVLRRGEYDQRADQVFPALPAVFQKTTSLIPTNRLGLAQWIVSESNPLTARVWVNRQWERFFGVGIVKTTENFGSQSDPPSHPELLDWLAAEFMRANWDMKALIKLMVMSASYRQSSKVSHELMDRDPENRLLTRAPRLRLPAELIRDQALSIGGLLVDKIGGASVRPYMPEGVWDETSRYGDLRGYKADKGEGLYRRSLYTIWKRTAPPPSMTLFDAPTREICTVKRSRTNTPLQALALLNEITYVEAARGLATRMLRSPNTHATERISFGFRLATGRNPTPNEILTLHRGLSTRLNQYKSAPDRAEKLISIGESKPDPQLDPLELAAYTVTANVILNLDETNSRE